MKQSGNRRKVTERSGSLVVTIPPALAADKRIKGGTIVEWRTTTDGLQIVPVDYEEPQRKEEQ